MPAQAPNKATDWDAYYKRPAATAQFTRRITAARIQRVLAGAFTKDRVAVCELGGANSCFIDDFLARPAVAAYHIVDTNAFGLDLVTRRFAQDKRVDCRLADALTLEAGGGSFDIVYSVGLIEHFDRAGTARCIASHFHMCKPGGTVLIKFPTPTVLYRAIRGAADALGMWAFPDERPLQLDEVVSSCAKHGVVTHRSINWAIGLTQGYIMTQKSG